MSVRTSDCENQSSYETDHDENEWNHDSACGCFISVKMKMRYSIVKTSNKISQGAKK